MSTKKVVIGIQARSTSERLPNKAFELIGGKRCLDHVIDAAKSAATFLRKNYRRLAVDVDVVVLTPVGDPISSAFRGRSTHIVEGPEHDVLTRFGLAAREFGADYMIRLTGDCPLIPNQVISRMASVALVNGYDYVSNVDERLRSAVDGHDCEVMSRALLEWAEREAMLPQDREHVTTLMRREPPSWARMAAVTTHAPDLSGLKLSVDTAEDLERVRREYEKVEEKQRMAVLAYGKHAVHKL